LIFVSFPSNLVPLGISDFGAFLPQVVSSFDSALADDVFLLDGIFSIVVFLKITRAWGNGFAEILSKNILLGRVA
jgi:hypothetical protein